MVDQSSRTHDTEDQGHEHKHNDHSTKERDHDHGEHEGHGGEHDHREHHRHMAEDFKRRFWISLIITIPVILLAPMVQQWLGLTEALAFTGDRFVLFALATVIFIYGGYPFLKGLVQEVGRLQPGMMTLIGLAISVAFVYSTAVVFGLPGKTFFWELATLVVVMLLGHYIEMKSVLGASKALDELAKLLPREAHRVTNGSTEDVPVAKLEQGDRVIVKPGEKVPADGQVVEGRTTVNEAMVTGESKPVEKSEGAEVIGGSVNGEGSITVEIHKVGEESFLSQVMNLVQSAQQSKSRTQNLADRAAMWLTFIAIGAGLLTWALWFYAFDREFVFALSRTVTVMVITCPHALGLAIPLVVAVSTSLSAKNGLLIRNRTQFEAARNLQAVVFDKTGTLTQGTFEVDEVLELNDNYAKKAILSLAGSVESRSEHPIAQAIAAAAEDKHEVSDFEAITGKGAQGKVDGQQVMVVSPQYVKEQGLDSDSRRVQEFTEQGKTVVFVVVESTVIGAVSLRDPVREESAAAVRGLHDMGLKVLMITGDNEHVAREVAEELGIEDFFAGVMPEKKSEKIQKVQQDGLKVAMVGDGVNDAPALAQADLGIAIGAGTDVAAEAADVVLVKNNPLDIVKIIKYSEATYKKMIQNLIYATGYNVFAIPLAAGALYSVGILLNPAVGALLMSLSTVAVAINARFLSMPETAGKTKSNQSDDRGI